MTIYFLKTFAAQLRRSGLLYLLTVLGVALGVASVLCIQILNRSSLSAFTGSVRAVSGDADLMIAGRTPVVDEALYPEVLAVSGVEAAWPLYKIHVSLDGRKDFYLQVIGVDFFAPLSLPLYGDGREETVTPEEGPAAPADFLGRHGWTAVTPALAREMGWRPGDTFRVSSGSRTADLFVGALVDFQRYVPTASRRLAVMDIAQAQALLGRRGEIHQIDVRLAEGADLETVRGRLSSRLGAGVQVLTPEQRQQDAAGLLSAFRLNLTALSLISLLVGVFLVYSSVQASLVRRRAQFGLLRSLGSTRRQVLALILGETAILGGVGVALGIPIGYAAAVLNVDTVSATLTNIYVLEAIERLRVGPMLYLLAAAVGIGGSLLGAVQPALDMARRDTHSMLAPFTLHQRVGRLAPRLAAAAVLMAAGGIGWFAAAGREVRWGGFALAVLLLVALPLLTPAFVRRFCGLLPVRSLGLAYSMKNLALRLQTSSVAVAAMGIAVSMMVGITLMVSSFRETLRTWIDTSLYADIYVTTESWARAGREAFLDPKVIDELTAHPAVRGVVRLRRFTAHSGDRPITLSGIAAALDTGEYRLALKTGSPETVMRRLRAEGAAVISEPLARKTGLGVGDRLPLYGIRGEVRLPIVGITYDYSTERGSALVLMDTMERHFGPGPTNNVALFLAAGEDPERTADELRTATAGVPLIIRSNRQLREEILAIFEQTFAVTRILQAMALIIAVTGVSLTLLIMARERVAELALYRALGAVRPQIFRIFVGEGLSLGALGLALGAVGGVLLALLLIYVINPAYFGWTIRPAPAWRELIREGALILGSAFLAAVYPAVRSSRVPVAELSRDDL